MERYYNVNGRMRLLVNHVTAGPMESNILDITTGNRRGELSGKERN